MSENEDIPKLDPPGFGLPIIQEFVLRYVAFPILRRVFTWEKASERFISEGERIRTKINSIPVERRTKRVLAPRLMGIEDSSRYWSLSMTLEHILIVSTGVLQLIGGLSRGEKFEYVVDTAKVKPDSSSAEDIEQRFAELIESFSSRVNEGVVNRDINNCHVHPWFGCLNPHGWVVMLAIHQFVHRRQVEKICSRLAGTY